MRVIKVGNLGVFMSQKAKIKVCPSMLAADFTCLASEAQRAEKAGADRLHLDIMDGHFVPNISFGPAVVSAINRSTSLFLDVHLMIYNPYDYIERFAQAGADQITIHFEATENVEETLEFIRRCNMKAGLAFNPETSDSMVLRFLDKCDMILMMTVQPGFGGQQFMPEVLEKVRFVRQTCEKLGIREGGVTVDEDSPPEKKALAPFSIQVDGGINEQTAAQCIEAGADVLVSGTHLFKVENMADAISQLRQTVQKES